MKPLTDSKHYERFVKQRDEGLERVLNKYLASIDQIVESLRIRCHEVAAHISTQGQSRELAKRNRQTFEHRIAPWFDVASHRAAHLIGNLRRTAFAISYVGEAEAIGRATGARTAYRLDAKKLELHSQKEMTFGGSILARIELGFHRLQRDVLDAFQASQVQESPIEETLERIDRAFPPRKKVKRITKLIAPMREARRIPQDDDEDQIQEGFSFGELDENEWNKIVDDYTSDELPFGRAPEDKILLGTKTPEGEDEFVYSWQVEQEATDDFVSSVRSGEILAANENGITDFLWIAIVDSKTDDCCLWRDGKTTTEIEDALNDEHSDDECDTTVPPAHYNCRCRVAPMTDDMPDEPPPDQGDFDSWLNST